MQKEKERMQTVEVNSNWRTNKTTKDIKKEGEINEVNDALIDGWLDKINEQQTIASEKQLKLKLQKKTKNDVDYLPRHECLLLNQCW